MGKQRDQVAEDQEPDNPVLDPDANPELAAMLDLGSDPDAPPVEPLDPLADDAQNPDPVPEGQQPGARNPFEQRKVKFEETSPMISVRGHHLIYSAGQVVTLQNDVLALFEQAGAQFREV